MIFSVSVAVFSPPISWLRCGLKNSGNAAEFDGKVLWSFFLREK
jgi:hypothetical protein